MIRRFLFISILLVVTMTYSMAQNDGHHPLSANNAYLYLNNYPGTVLADSSVINEVLAKNQRRIEHHVLAGAKVGLLFAFGLEINYILSNKRTNILYLAAAAQSSIIWNTVNAGGGFFLGNTGFGVGCRYNHVLWFELENSEKSSPGYEPEIVWYKKVGFNRNMYINLHGGAIITKSRVFPDVTIGFMLPLR